MVYVVLSELGGAGAGRGGGVEEAGGLGPRVEAVAAARQEGKTAAERNRSENSSSPWMELRMSAGSLDQSAPRDPIRRLSTVSSSEYDRPLQPKAKPKQEPKTGGNWKVDFLCVLG